MNPFTPIRVDGVAHNINHLSTGTRNLMRKIVRKGQSTERRMAVAESMNLKLANDIREFLKVEAMPGKNFFLPHARADYKLERDELWLDKETGEILTDREAHYLPLIRTYYALFSNYHQGAKRTLGKLYVNDDGNIATNPAMIAVSRHKLNHVWNFYKSQIIRRKYLKLLQDWDAQNILRNYNPVHITLTVPRDKEGKFEGEQFFGPQLLYYFNLMRKTQWWKNMVFAGEFGVECKKGKTVPGYHIHIHSFALLHANYKVNALRKKIAAWWLKNTGGKLIGVETLYVTERHSNGKPVFEYQYTQAKGKVIYNLSAAEYKAQKAALLAEGIKPKKVKKKRYIDPATSPIADYLSGVMECIKYHFKPDMFLVKTTDSTGRKVKKHDVAAILEVLKGTHNKRLYSKYGMFWWVKELALGFKEEGEAQIINVAELAAMESGEYFENATVEPSSALFIHDWEAEQHEAQLLKEMRDEHIDSTALGGELPQLDVNPFTLAQGEQADGWPVLYNVNNRKHPHADYYKTFDISPHYDSDLSQFIFLAKDAQIPEIIKLMALGRATPTVLKNKGYIDQSMKLLQDNLLFMLNHTKDDFYDKPDGLLTHARHHAMEYIATGKHAQIYEPDLVAVINKFKADNPPPKDLYYRAFDKYQPQETATLNPEVEETGLRSDLSGNIPNYAPDHNGNHKWQLKETTLTQSRAAKAIEGGYTAFDAKKALNLKGRLTMQVQHTMHYLRTQGYKIDVATTGHITKIYR